MKYFVGMELGVANVLQRHFDWGSNSLWCEEIPNARDPSKAVFFVGGKDDIIDAKVCLKFSGFNLFLNIPSLVISSVCNDISLRMAFAKV